MRDEAGTTTSTYDARGRLSSVSRTIADPTKNNSTASFTESYGYDSSDVRTSVTYPTGETVTTTSNSQNQPKRVTSGTTTYLDNLTYNRLSLPVQLSYGTNGPTTSFSYYGLETADSSPSSFGRLWQIRTFSGSSEYGRLEYAYDRVGNVTILADWGPGSKRGRQLFTYDALDRLTSTQPDPNWPASTSYNGSYAYDTIGNLTAKHEWGPSDADVTRTLAYGNASHVHAPSSVTTNGTTDSYSYDANGNLTSRAAQTLVYDAENRLIRVRNAANEANILRVIYDGDGQRILTVDSTGTRVTLDKLYEKNLTTGDETLFVYAGSRLIATKKNGTVSTIHPDHLGGIALTLQGSTVVADLAFYPFGEQRSTSTGTPTSDLRFNGESFITSAGLYQMGARWYDPAIGGFLSPDSIVPVPAQPQTLNRYAFANHNPVKYVDSSGHFAFIPLLIMGAFLAYDLYQAHQTFNDPNATNVDKGIAVASVALDVVPGGGAVAGRALKVVAQEAVGQGAKGIAKEGVQLALKRGAEEAASRAGGFEGVEKALAGAGKHGITVIRDADELLKAQGAHAAYMRTQGGPGWLFIGKDTEFGDVMHELKHFSQHRKGGWETAASSRQVAEDELEAFGYEIRNARRWKYSEEHLEELDRWQQYYENLNLP